MNRTDKNTLTAFLPASTYEKAKIIIYRSGESKSDLINRLIIEEHKKVILNKIGREGNNG